MSRKAKFGPQVESCPEKLPDCPSLITGSATVGFGWFFRFSFANMTLGKAAATRYTVTSAIFFCIRNTGNMDLSTAAGIFLFLASPTYYGRLCNFAKWKTKKQQIFFRLTAFHAAGGGGIFGFYGGSVW